QFNYDYYNEIGSSKAKAYADVFEPAIQAIEERSGKAFSNPGNVVFSQASYQKRLNRLIDFFDQNKETYPEFQDFSSRNFDEQAKELARNAEEASLEMDQKVTGLSGFAAQLYGSGKAFFTDPAQLALLPAGLYSKAASLLQLAVREAVIGATAEAVNQVGVSQWYDELGKDYTYKDFVYRTGLGATFGALFPVAAVGAGNTIKLTYNQAKRGLEAFNNAGFPKGPIQRAAEAELEKVDAAIADNPLSSESAVGAALEHQERLAAADEAINFDAMFDAPEMPASNLNEKVFESQGLQFVGSRFIDTDEILVDAKTFQYKDADEFGVTKRLAEETTWRPELAGVAIVYEYRDGRKVIADGHQRMALAKRIKEANPGTKIDLHAQVYREVDGWTPDQVKVQAAVVNIANGSGTAIDAAKILRVSPDVFDRVSMPQHIAMYRHAVGLVNLSNDNFRAVINNVIPASHGAIIGRMIPDNPDLQQAAVTFLAKQNPANEFQAESMVAQVREIGFEKMTQDGLFGEEVFAESFITERAVILDRVMKEIRRDKAAFNTITRNAERIEQEGNVLDRTNNKRRINDEQKTLDFLQALANAKGPLSDALTAAARKAKETGSYTESVREFRNYVGDSIKSGDFERVTASDVKRYVDDKNQSKPSPTRRERDDEVLEGFSDPASDLAKRNIDQLTDDLMEPGTTSVDQGIIEMIRKSIDEFDEDAYIRLINPKGDRIPDESLTNLTSEQITDSIDLADAKLDIIEDIDGITYIKSGTTMYAYDEPNGLFVGYQAKTDSGAELNVATDYRDRGIEGNLSFLFRSQNPKMPSGGLSVAGEAAARFAFRKMKEMSFIENDVTKYFVKTDDSIDIPVSQLTPTRARPEGVFSSKVFMAAAARGEMAKRPPIEVRANEDGTYTLRDGNSTYAVAVAADWETIPVRVLSDEEYAKAVQAKAIDRVLNPGAKDKGRTITKQFGEDIEFAAFEAEMKKRQQFQSIEDVMERGQKNHQMFNEIIEEITADLGIPFYIEKQNGVVTVPPVKKVEDVRRKLIDFYGAPADDLNPVDWLYMVTDVARSGMTVENPAQVRAVLDALNSEKYKLHVVDEGFKKTKAGYFDAKALVQAPDGQLMELQFWPPGMLFAKQDADLTEFGYPATYFDEKAGKEKPYVGGHKLYEIIQNRSKTYTAEQIADAEKHSRTLYGRVLAELGPEFYPLLDMLGIERRSVLKTNARLDASASDISTDLSLARMAPGEALPQTPATGFQTAAEELSSEIAARNVPSTLKNLTYDTSEDIVTELDQLVNSSSEFPTDDLFFDGDVLVSKNQTIADLRRELEHDQEVLDRFKDCVI
ncbi:MAG: hypothetical protein VW270_03365, partial [Candidatus Poseidoniales archaeon]